MLILWRGFMKISQIAKLNPSPNVLLHGISIYYTTTLDVFLTSSDSIGAPSEIVPILSFSADINSL